VTTRRTGQLVGAALAVGLALGFGGSVLAADPTAPPAYHSMMGGRGMMGGATLAPGSTLGPAMMGNLSEEQRQQLLEGCDRIHDAIHGSASPAPAASTTQAPR
jgi:hypothetical protein